MDVEREKVRLEGWVGLADGLRCSTAALHAPHHAGPSLDCKRGPEGAATGQLEALVSRVQEGTCSARDLMHGTPAATLHVETARQWGQRSRHAWHAATEGLMMRWMLGAGAQPCRACHGVKARAPSCLVQQNAPRRHLLLQLHLWGEHLGPPMRRVLQVGTCLLSSASGGHPAAHVPHSGLAPMRCTPPPIAPDRDCCFHAHAC